MLMNEPLQLETHDDVELVARLAQARRQIVEQLRRRIVGQDRVIDLLLVALFAKGHGLLVGVPGLAKTSLVTSLAQALSLRSNRIQFTPDLMPTDITGTDVLEQDAQSGQRHFRFVPGPVFTNVLLADEINRTPPKTQAALLQAMEEHRVTVGGVTHPLEAPYLVFATQNPIEQEGTYPLPEAQLDRFMLQIEVGYPSAADELEIVRRTTAPDQQTPSAVLSRPEILWL
jgi:MoxR-like ATPase